MLSTANIAVHLPESGVPKVKAIIWKLLKAGLGHRNCWWERWPAMRCGDKVTVEIHHASSKFDGVFPQHAFGWGEPIPIVWGDPRNENSNKVPSLNSQLKFQHGLNHIYSYSFGGAPAVRYFEYYPKQGWTKTNGKWLFATSFWGDIKTIMGLNWTNFRLTLNYIYISNIDTYHIKI